MRLPIINSNQQKLQFLAKLETKLEVVILIKFILTTIPFRFKHLFQIELEEFN